MRKRNLASAITILLIISATISFSTVVVRMSLNEMAAEAEMVFSGTVTNIETAWNAEKTSIFTYVSFKELYWVRGNARESKVTLRLRGGKVGHDVIVVSGMPEFNVGDRYVILAKVDRGERGHYSPIVGFFQGAFIVNPKKDGREEFICNSEGYEVSNIQDGKLILVPPRENPSSVNVGNIKNVSALSREPFPDQDDFATDVQDYVDTENGGTSAIDESTMVPVPSRTVRFRKEPVDIQVVPPAEPQKNEKQDTEDSSQEMGPKQILLIDSTDPGTRLTEMEFLKKIANIIQK